MKRALRLALVVVLAVASPAAGQGTGPGRVPPDFPIPKAESSPGEVTFSHARHRPKVRKCSTCHMKDLKMQRGRSGPITLEAKQQGKYCGACHDGQTRMGGDAVFPIEECDRCHQS